MRTKTSAYTGPALFSYGFRPLFLLAGSFAALVVPLWMAVWTGRRLRWGSVLAQPTGTSTSFCSATPRR
jgi:uncharacterized protein involved in response to NO